jgi:hypothetical protein
VFYWSRAPDPSKDVPEFRLGCKEFWREAGCSYVKQLRKSMAKREIDLTPRDEWEKNARIWQEWDEKQSDDEVDDIEGTHVNTTTFAKPEEQADFLEKQKKKYRWPDESGLSRTRRELDEMFKYRPGPMI